MKTEISSNFSAILAILSNLQGNKSLRFENYPMSPVTEKEVGDDATIDAMEVYYYIL